MTDSGMADSGMTDSGMTDTGLTPTDAGEEADALAAADRIIDDFAHHRRDAYFAGFAPDATFLFHNVDHRLESRQAYETLWAEWESEGFQVLSCSSSNRRIQLLGSIAVFSHDVETNAKLGGVAETSRERETIVLGLTDGVWLGIHEHLSARG